MTITSTPSEVSYAGDGVTVAFPIPFVFDTAADLKVLSTDADGNISTLTTGFSVSGGSGSTGTLTFGTAPASTVDITVLDNPEVKQATDYVSNDPFPAESHERALDRLTRICKRLTKLFARTLHTQDGDPISDLALGSVDNRKGKYLFFNAITGAIEYAANIVTTTLSQSIIAQLLNPQTAAEAAAGATIVNYWYKPGYLLRYKSNTVPGTTDMADALQMAINSATVDIPEVFMAGDIGIGKTVVIPESSPSNLSLIGAGRTTTILYPLAADISVSFRTTGGYAAGSGIVAEDVNTIFFNQKGNGHLHMRHIRCLDAVAYTGKFLVAIEDGGADFTGEALFSAAIDDCWFSFSANNTGIFQGGFSNLIYTRNTHEGVKDAAFILQGAGNGDLQFTDNVCNASFDSFIRQADDGHSVGVLKVTGLQAYQHLRGRLIEVVKARDIQIQGVTLEADAANFGDVGLFKIGNVLGGLISDFLMTTENGTPRGAIGIDFTTTTACRVRIANGDITADVGVKFTGTGAINASMAGVSLFECENGIQVSAACSGHLRTKLCEINNSDKYGVLHSIANSMKWTDRGSEIMNAGMDGTTTARNIDANSSGTIRLLRTSLGHDDVSAAATHRIRAEGAGTFEVVDPILIGTPPTALKTGSQTVSYDGVDSSMPGMPAFVPSVGGTATYTTQQGRWSLKNKTLHFHGRLTINAIGTGSTTTMSGLPFTSHATHFGAGLVSFFSSVATSVTGITFTVPPGSTQADFRSLAAAGTGTANNAIFQNAADIIFSGSYPLP